MKKTAAQIANDAKIRLQKELIERLRRGGLERKQDTWRQILTNRILKDEIDSYDLSTPQRRSHLSKVAFADCNRHEVDAALEAGANLNKLYALACGRAHIAKDSTGRYCKGKKGLKIVDNVA